MWSNVLDQLALSFSTMASECLLIKNGTHLEAAEPSTSEIIQKMRQGEIVTATIRRARNPGHHRKMMALLNAVYENQNRYPTLKGLLSAIKVWTGHYDSFIVDGKEYFTPKSISFSNMDQAEFESFYSHVINIILEKILPGLNKADLERRVLEILGNDA